MEIYRLEYKRQPKHGPWYVPPSQQLASFLGLYRNAAGKADDVAEKQGVHMPSEHPSPAKDPGLMDADLDLETKKYFFGFADLDEYKLWFQTPEVREAVLDHGKLVLAKYEVPDEKVIKGHCQVIFSFDDVQHKEVLTHDFAVHPT